MLRQEYQDIRAALSAVDEVLKNISALDQATDERELNRVLPALLESMGRYAAADRAYLFGWTDEKRLALHMTHEWCAPGVRPTMDEMQDLRMADMPNWAPRLRRGEAIVSDNWDAERERTPEEFRLFDGQDIHALMVIPILANQTLSGYIGFDNPDQSTSALSVRLLTSIGGHLGSLRENLWMMAELEEKRRTLQENFDALSREKHVLDALSIDYTSVYYCDLEADTMLPMKQGADTNAAVADSELTSGHQKYSFRIRYYYENFVVQESAQDFLEKMSADYLRAYLKEKDRFAYRFRTHSNPAGQQYFEVQVVRLRDMPGFKAVMGYRYIDDIVLEQERQRQQLEQALSTAKQLVEKMGGDVRIKSQRDVGTRVEVTLTFDVDRNYEAAARQTEREERIDLTGVRVLLVEDNDLNMECARFTLEQVGMEVKAVDAFAQSDPGQFDLILMDVMMPVLDGLGATRAIRAMDRPDASAVPIFAMTANAFPEDMALSRHAGMNEHLSKPLRENELLKTIRRYVKSRSC